MMTQQILDEYLPHFPDYDLYKKIKYRNVKLIALNSKGGKTSKTGQFKGFGNARIYIETEIGFKYKYRHSQIVSIEVIP